MSEEIIGLSSKLKPNTEYTEEELKDFAEKVLTQYYESGQCAKLDGKYNYPNLLTYNILIAHFDEFKQKPFSSFIRYFESPKNIAPLFTILGIENLSYDEVKGQRDFYERSAHYDMIKLDELGMESWDATQPIAKTHDPIYGGVLGGLIGWKKKGSAAAPSKDQTQEDIDIYKETIDYLKNVKL